MTETRHSDEALLAIVQKSPAAVAAKDREAWLSIFAAYNIVEDPVGSRPHISGVYDAVSGRRGNAPLARFFDTFIAPNEIHFHVVRDIVSDYHVVRDLSIEIRMSPEVSVKVPMHLIYVLGQQGDTARVFRLAAHWELLPMLGQAMGFGLASLRVMMALGLRMLRLQGVGGIVGFSRALSSVGRRGKAVATAFATAYNARDGAGMGLLFDAAPGGVSWPAPGKRTTPDALMARASGRLSFGKTLVSGHVVSASARWCDGDRERHGVLFFEFTRDRKIDRLSAYWEDPVNSR